MRAPAQPSRRVVPRPDAADEIRMMAPGELVVFIVGSILLVAMVVYSVTH